MNAKVLIYFIAPYLASMGAYLMWSHAKAFEVIIPETASENGAKAHHLQIKDLYSPNSCIRCHQEITAQWKSSSHRLSSFNNPYYRAAARAFDAEKGRASFSFCADCHDPALRADQKAMGAADAFETQAARAGVGCLICHSISQAPEAGGNGQVKVKLDPMVFGKSHHARFASPLLKEGQLCVSCHDVMLTPPVTNDRFFQGQDDGDMWTNSAYGGGGITSPWSANHRTCQSCHMPKVPARRGDRAAKDGLVRSHRFAGANTALAHVFDDVDQLKAQNESLRDSILIEAVRSSNNMLDVVLFNDRVGHRFPGGVNDSNQAWLSLTVFDANQTVIGQIGALKPDGRLPNNVHLIRAQAVDQQGEPLAHRDVQNQRGVVFDTSLYPLWPRLVRFRLPDKAHRVHIALKYRQFGIDYVEFACHDVLDPAMRMRCLQPPVTVVRQFDVDLESLSMPDTVNRNIRWAQGLSDGLPSDVSQAVQILLQLRRSNPKNRMVTATLAYAQSKLGRTDAVLSLTKTLIQDDAIGRFALWVQIETLLKAYRIPLARRSAEQLLKFRPNDRRTLALVSALRNQDTDNAGALSAAELLLSLDPMSAVGWLQRSIAHRGLGRADSVSMTEWSFKRPHMGRTLELRRTFRSRYPEQEPLLNAIPTHPISSVANKPKKPP